MATFNVSNAQQLMTAIGSAQGGDVILLAPGNYGDITLWRKEFSSDITIKSVDPENPAVLESLYTYETKNVKFDSVFIDFVPGPDTISTDYAVRIIGSSGISIVNSEIEGGAAVNGVPQDTPTGGLDSTGNVLGLPTGRGMIINDSKDIHLENNEIHAFHKGITFGNVDQIVVRNNDIHNLRTTPLSGGNLDDVLVEGNHFHSFQPWQLGGAGDHGDLIHFWTDPGRQSTASNNIVIRDNFFEQGDGAALLGIYLDDNNNGLGFTNVVITQNVIVNGDRQGLRLENVVDALITYNTLLQSSSGDSRDAPEILLYSGSTATIRNNISGGSPGSLTPDANGNVKVQRHDPLADNYYGKLFVDALGDMVGLPGLQFLPDSALAALQAGATVSRFDSTPDDLTALVLKQFDSEDATIVSFDARLTADSDGFVGAGEATFKWNFGDGATGTGIEATHQYREPGTYEVTLTVRRPDGSVDDVVTTVVVPDPLVLDLHFGSAPEPATSVASYLASRMDGAISGNQSQNALTDVFHLTSTNEYSSSKSVHPGIYALEEFTLSFNMKRDSASAGTGDLMRVHGSWYLKLESDGSLSFKYDDAANRTYTIRSNVKITDTQWHDIDLTFDTDTGKAVFYIDGEAAGQGSIGQRLQGAESWGFSIGNPFGSNATATFSNIKMWTQALTQAELNGEVGGQSSSTVARTNATVADVADEPVTDQQAAIVEKVAAPEASPSSVGDSVAGAFGQIKTFDLSNGLGEFLADTRYDRAGGVGSMLKDALSGAAGASNAPLGDLLAEAFSADDLGAFDFAAFGAANDLNRPHLVHEGVLLV